MRKLLLFSKNDTLKKKINTISIWLLAIIFPFLFSTIIHISLIEVTGLYYLSYFCNSYLGYVLLPLFSLISIGLIFGSKLMRKATLFVLYLSMILMITEHVMKSMEIYRTNGCLTKFIGYGIDYDSLIYPDVILKWSMTIVLIILFHMLLAYLFNSKEGLQLYTLPKKIRIKENLLLGFHAGMLTVVFILFPVTTLLCISKKDIDMSILNQVKIVQPKTVPAIKLQTIPPWLTNGHNLTYKIKFESSNTIKASQQ